MSRPARAVRRDRWAWLDNPTMTMLVGVLAGALTVTGGASLGVHLTAPSREPRPTPTVTLTAPPPTPTPSPTASPSSTPRR